MRQAYWLAFVASSLIVGCKPFHANEATTNLKADDGNPESLEPARDLATGRPVADDAAPFRELEVVDCPAEICTADTDLVEATPEGTDQLIASTLGERRLPGDSQTAFALAGPNGTASFEDVAASNASLSQTFAGGGLDGLRAMSALVTIGNTLSQLEGQTPREKVASAKSVLAALHELDRSTGPELRKTLLQGREALARYKPLKALLAQLGENSGDDDVQRLLRAADGALAFFRENLVSSTDDGKLKILEAMLEAIPAEFLAEGQNNTNNTPSALASLGDAKTAALIAAARRFAGRDGFVNRGDAVRILPVVPRLVEEVADQKIAEGFAQGMAQLAAEHPFVYRRWMRRPNGLIGRAVNKGIGNAMAQADAAKWKAVREAGAATQKMFDDMMGELGVKRYYLDLEADTNHWDPDTELGTGEIRSLVQTLTGMSVDQVATKMMTGGGANAQANLQTSSAKLRQMVDKLSFPDGVPVNEVVLLLDAYRSGGEVKIPRGMDFRLGDSGKVEVLRHHDRCECYYEPQVKACIMTFKPAGDATLRFYPSDVASDGTCDYKTQCHANFVKGGRTVNLMKACGQTFRDRATGNVYVYRNQ